LTTSLKANLAGRLPPAVEQGLYYIAQEALNNALKHSRAKSIAVCLLQNGAAVCLEIADDGVGFEAAHAYQQGKLGLPDMEQRASELGGRLVVTSEPGQGTRIRVELML
jgi:signal transduction histidine kinase